MWTPAGQPHQTVGGQKTLPQHPEEAGVLSDNIEVVDYLVEIRTSLGEHVGALPEPRAKTVIIAHFVMLHMIMTYLVTHKLQYSCQLIFPAHLHSQK